MRILIDNKRDGIPFDENNSPIAIEIKENRVWVTLADGRIISNPLNWHPWLMNATPQQLSHSEFWTDAVYFTDLDEGLDIEAMLKGAMKQSHTPNP